MTAPKQAKKTSSRGPRTYAWPPMPPHEFEVISVTSAIGAGLPKPFLIGWAAKITAECAVDEHDVVSKMIEKGNERHAVDYIKGARYRDMGEKADRGTIVHSAIEAYLAGDKQTKEVIEAKLTEARVPKEMWKSTAAMISGVMDFLYDFEPEVFQSESTVYSRKHGYAGTLDLVAKIRVGDSIVPAVIDIKTSKRIYDEVALQLCAYARADFVGLDDGTEAPLLPGDDQTIEYGVVVRPTASGTYEKQVFTLTDELFELYLSVLGTAKNLDVLDTVRRPG